LAPPTGRGPDRAAEFLRACEGQVSGALGGGALGARAAAHATLPLVFLRSLHTTVTRDTCYGSRFRGAARA
jgi:hypothetical protein